MCEVLAILANQRVGAHLSWAGLQLGSARNPDGWGAAWVAGEHFALKKEPRKLPSGKQGRHLISNIRSQLFLAHTRYKVDGKRLWANTQPFVSDEADYAFAGTMDGCYARRRFRKRVRDMLRGQTGPEVLFRMLLQGIEEHGLKGLAPVIAEFFNPDELRANATASFVLCSTKRVFIFRHKKPLYYRNRTGPYDGTVRLRGLRHQRYEVRLRFEKESTERATIIATEPLTDEPWLIVPDRTLCSVRLGGIRELAST